MAVINPRTQSILAKNNSRQKLTFFLPDWDDRVWSEYNFISEDSSGKRVYQHEEEIYGKPNFDGLLVSKIKLERSNKVLNRIKKIGIHEHLKYDGPVFGDNGAYSFVDEKYPKYKVDELAHYYDDIGVDLGVSLDHLCIPKHQQDWELRQQITIDSAGKFMDLHQKNDYQFIPVGSAQGWDSESYYESIEALLDANYEFIAIGGVSGATTQEILRILKYVSPLIKDPDLDVHLFGVARLKYAREFMELGVTSLDSASMIRSAFKGFRKNYYDINYQPYAALRIPYASRLRSKDFKYLEKNGLVSKEHLKDWEESLYQMLFEYEAGIYSAEEVVEAFQLFESAYMRTYDHNRFWRYLKTLKDKPWKDCPCKLCKELGIEIMIFRGNARNRRRGFHNSFVFYRILQKIINDPDFDLSDLEDEDETEDDEDYQSSLDDYFS